MGSLATRVFGRAVDLRSGEALTTWLLFSYSFLAMTAYNILKPITRSKFITALGADNLPYVQLAAGCLIAVMMHVYGQAAQSLPRRLVIPVTQWALAAVLVVFWALFRTDADWVAVAFYVVTFVLGILLISQFWTVANDVYDARQAKRLFGFIGGGASLGGALGAGMTAVAVEWVGTDNLLLVSAAVLALSAWLVLAIFRTQPAAVSAHPLDDLRGLGGRESLRLLLESRHVQVIALVIACAAIGATIIEQQLNMAAEAMSGAENTIGITAFLAQVTFYLSVIGFVVQIALTSRIHRAFGLAFALLLLPVSLGATAAVILVTASPWALAVARVLDSTLRYTIDKTSREVLFLPLPAALKYRAKPFIDVTMDRFAKAMGALLVLVLIKPWGFGLDWQRLSYASLTIMGLWIACALTARREYLKTFRSSIGTHAIAPAAVRVDAADAQTIETLVEELSNPDETAVLYAIDMLEALDKRNLVTPLLLHHESPKVRARALLALGATRAGSADRWTAVVGRMLSDEDVDVRAAAMRALTLLRREDAIGLMRRYLEDPEPRVALTAAVGLADSGIDSEAAAAEFTVMRLVRDTRQSAAAGRLEAARALAHIRHRRFRLLLVPLLYDADIAVVREAIKTARAMGISDGLFVPGLLSLLGHRVLKSHAREALVSYGEDVIDALAFVLRDQREHIWIRRHIPATLALVPTQHSMDILMEAIDDPDGFLRYKVLEAVERLRRGHPHLAFSLAVVEAMVLKETARYYGYLTLRYNLSQHPGSDGALIVRTLADKLDRTLDRIYRLLGLLYPARDVAAARYTIERGEGRRRAAALEYLDNLLRGAVRKRVMPIVEHMPMEQKVHYANLVLGIRRRDVVDTLAQLVHEDDPVVAAAAIYFIWQERLEALTGDLEYVLVHRQRSDRYVIEAATRALAGGPAAADHAREEGAIPVVELADRLRSLPLFDFVSVDELFRVAEGGHQVGYNDGQTICHEGAAAEDVWFLLDGGVRLAGGGEPAAARDAPAVLGLEDVLQGRSLTRTVVARGGTACFRIASNDFLTMISDNIVLAQGLFRMLLTASGRHSPSVYAPPPEATAILPRGPLQPIEKVMLLRSHPLLGRATTPQLLEMAAIAREVALTAGHVLFNADEPAAIYLVLQGAVVLETDSASPVQASGGVTFGVAETLAGMAAGRRALVTRDGHALKLDRDELFVILADHVDLLQGLFSGVLALTVAPLAARDRALEAG